VAQCLENALRFAAREVELSTSGVIVMVTRSWAVRRKLIWVAKRVHKVLATGNGIPVSAYRIVRLVIPIITYP